jgi:decaprenyl-phosphate phosphoribosyltransferase
MIPPLIRLLRPGDWVKNIFVLPALVFRLPSVLPGGAEAGSVDVRSMCVAAGTAFVGFCMLSSGFYAVNDVLDVEKDRLHPVKSTRPVASGAVRPTMAMAVGLVLIAAGLALGFLVNRHTGSVMCMYAGVQALYNLRLKRVMLVDVVAVALGFAFRATAGAVAIGVQISVWLVLCVFFLCLYLGFIKRLCDLSSAEVRGKGAWRSPAGYDDRAELNWLLGVSGVLAIVTYLMYALSDHAWSIFGSRSIGFALLSPLVMIAIHRFYRRASTGASDSPLEALLEDRTVLVSVVLFSIGVIVSLYVKDVQQALDAMFIVHVKPSGT